MEKRRLSTAITILAATATAAAGFEPDPEGQYDTMRQITAHSVPSQVALFEDMIAGSENCSPQLYLDAGVPGYLDVTLLAPCYHDAKATVLYHGTAHEVHLSENGAGFARIESTAGAGRVTAAFQGGTVVMQDISVTSRSAALLVPAQDG